MAAFHAGRLLSYALGGAVAAASVGALSGWAQYTPLVRPLWTLVHVGALVLGAWLVWFGRQPAWLENLGRWPVRAVPRGGAVPLQRMRLQGALRAAGSGSLWIVLPCGLLQSALVLAALGNTAWSGAAIMAAFAIGSSVGLWAGPALWWRLTGRSAGIRASVWAIRFAGFGLMAASGWSLGHGLWMRVLDYCFG